MNVAELWDSPKTCVLYAIFTQIQDEMFSLNLALKYMRSYEIHIRSTEPDHAKLDCSELDHAEPN